MKKARFVVLFFISFILFFSYPKGEEIKIEDLQEVKIIVNNNKGLWEKDKKGKRIIYREELSIGHSEEDKQKIFFQPMDVIADGNDNIYVLDSGSCQIQKYDKTGKYLMTIGRKGQGPGEILNSQDIHLDSKKNIFVFDQGNNRIIKFDSLGKYIDSFNLNFRPFFGVLDSDDNIFIYGQYNGKLIHKFNSQGRFLFSFLDEVKSKIKRIEPHLNGLGRIGITKDDEIILVLTYPYTIYIFNKEGKLLKKIITETSYAEPPYITSPTDQPPDMVITNFLISGLAISPKGFIFCRVISFNIPDKLDSFEKIHKITLSLFAENSYVDLFDPNGNFLIHQKTPNFGWGGSFDNKGYYLGITEEKDYFIAVKYFISFQ
jgi:hypothetical protein